MCGLQPASCRLCLASDILPPYLDLRRDDTGQVEELSSLLSLDLTASPRHFPHYVCAICVGTFQSFIKLREAAQQNEKILQINEKMIRSVRSHLSCPDLISTLFYLFQPIRAKKFSRQLQDKSDVEGKS